MKILYLGSETGFRALQDTAGDSARAVHVEAGQEAVSGALEDADALLDASMKVRITNEMIDAAPRLKVIACATTGSDHIQREALEKRSIPVRTLKEDPDLLMNLTPAAELSWALVLACARKVPAALDHVKSGRWERERFPGIMLRGKRIGIIGCGRIGGWMARYAEAFGMEVVGYDPFADPWPDRITRVELDELLQTSDVVTIHVHLSDSTRGMLSRERIEHMKPGAVFVNTSRGALVDEAALLDALKEGRLGAVGLDVLDGEPEIGEHPLVEYARAHDNAIITPHCGGFSPDAVYLVCAHSAKKILSVLGLAS